MASVEEQLAEARRLLGAGREDEGLLMFAEAYPTVHELAQRVDLAGFLGVVHGRNGRWGEAERWFHEGLQQAPGNAALLFELSEVQAARGDPGAALETLLTALRGGSRNARHYLACGHHLFRAGRNEEALQVWSLGDDLDPMLTRAHAHPQADDTTKQRSREADHALRTHFLALHRKSVQERTDGEGCERVAGAVWCQTHPEPFHYRDPRQRPHLFYLPDLEPVPVFSREDLPWAAELEAAAGTIADEYRAAMDAGASGAPYVHQNAMRSAQWDALRGQEAWEALHLFKDGREDPALTARFPQTLKALEKVPLVRPNGTPLEVFFSVLKRGTHIPPHFGLANSRLTVHLPLIVPPRCAIRVGETTYPWTEGEVFAFDDSFEHEAWNRSEETRVVLIFEAWSPLLTEAEQGAITASFETRMAWLNARSLP